MKRRSSRCPALLGYLLCKATRLLLMRPHFRVLAAPLRTTVRKLFQGAVTFYKAPRFVTNAARTSAALHSVAVKTRRVPTILQARSLSKLSFCVSMTRRNLDSYCFTPARSFLLHLRTLSARSVARPPRRYSGSTFYWNTPLPQYNQESPGALKSTVCGEGGSEG